MTLALRDVATSAAFLFVAGLVLWPLGAGYWNVVGSAVGASVMVGLVAVAAGGLGAVLARVTGSRLRAVAAGGLVAYAGWMAVIETVMIPDSPVHFVWYAGLLACFLLGAGLWRVRARESAGA